MANQINCPNCQTQISVNEVLQSQLSEQIRKDIEAELRGQETNLRNEQQKVAEQQVQLKQQQGAIDSQIKTRVDAERAVIIEQAKLQAQESLNVELSDRTSQITELKTKLQQAQTKELELLKKERDLKTKAEAQQVELKQQQSTIDAKVKSRVDAERAAIIEQAKLEAQESLNVKLTDRTSQITELKTKLQFAQTKELELLKQKRELKTKTEELELSVARELETERDKIREAALKQAADERQLKDAEQQKVITDLNHQIDNLKRKAEQGCVQNQGEVQELALESMLETAFPSDSIEPVGKGVSGADNKQVVRSTTGAVCGSILWESKRTKSYNKSWLAKLRDDRRSARASIAVIVTQTMPEGVDTFTVIDGVWVCSWQCAKGLAMALRAGLIEVGKNQLAAEGRVEKMEMVYNYLSSKEFFQSVEGIVEAFVTMQSDLESEKRTTKRLWGKREKQIERAINNTASLYGDLQGIIGAAMPVIEGLSLNNALIDAPALELPLTAK